MSKWLHQYVRCVRIALARQLDPELAGVWKFALASIVFPMFAVLALGGGLADGGALGPPILVAVVCLGIAAASGGYVVFTVRRAGGRCGDWQRRTSLTSQPSVRHVGGSTGSGAHRTA